MLFLAIAYVCARGCWPRLVLICIVHSLERVLTLFACRTMAKRLKRLETALFCKFGYVLAHMSGSYGKHSYIWPETGNGSGKGAGSGPGWKKGGGAAAEPHFAAQLFSLGGKSYSFSFPAPWPYPGSPKNGQNLQISLKMAKTASFISHLQYNASPPFCALPPCNPPSHKSSPFSEEFFSFFLLIRGPCNS